MKWYCYIPFFLWNQRNRSITPSFVYWIHTSLICFLLPLSLKDFLHQFHLRFLRRKFFLFLNQQIESILQSILSTTWKAQLYSWPFFLAIAIQNYLEKFSTFIFLPWSFLNTRVLVATPVLSTLLWSSEYPFFGA